MFSAIGYRWFGFLEADRKSLRFTWLSVNLRPGLALALCNFGDDDDGGHFSLLCHLIWPEVFLRLPFLRRRPHPDMMLDSWGFSLGENSGIHLNWGRTCKIVHLPWALEWYRTSYLLVDGSWWTERRGKKLDFKVKRSLLDHKAWEHHYPYRYKLKSGEVQQRMARVRVNVWEWRRRWLPWTSAFAKVQRSIDVEFSDEVGERTGTWKGGTIGCGYEMLPGESALQTLRRMERERTFR